MTRTFFNAVEFNQPIGSWDVSDVFDMEDMFFEAQKIQSTVKHMECFEGKKTWTDYLQVLQVLINH